jgi:hypothetical protein
MDNTRREVRNDIRQKQGMCPRDEPVQATYELRDEHVVCALVPGATVRYKALPGSQ